MKSPTSLGLALVVITTFSCGAVPIVTADAGITACKGTNCECGVDQTCAFSACSASTSSCDFKCDANAICTGTAGPAANVQCNGKTCTHTVGAGSNVSCNAGNCTITCTGTCTVGGAVTTALTCQAGTKTAAGCQ